MATLLKIIGTEVKIGTDDGKVITVPIASISYPNPCINDQVNIFKDGESYIIQKVASTPNNMYQTETDGNAKTINKHVFVWVANFLFGGFGVDRFLRGQIDLGICKLLLSWFTLGIWWFVDFIIAVSKAYGNAYGNMKNVTFDINGNYIR